MISDALVRELAAQHGDPAVTTVYLDVDGRHRPTAADYEASFERLARDVRHRARALGDTRVVDAVEADLHRMREWLNTELDRSVTRGVAMFCASDEGFFRAVPLPRPVHDHATVGPSPRVTELIALLDEFEPFLVALVDRRRLRLLRFDLGEVVELPGLTDPEPRAVDTSVEIGGFERWRAELARAHFRRAAALLERTTRHWPRNRLILGGPDESLAGFEQELPASVRDLVVGRVSVATAAPLPDIIDEVLAVEEQAERRHEAELVEVLRQRAAGHRDAVVGLPATLRALADRRVWKLLVSDGFRAPGARCPTCGLVSVDVRQCPSCGTTNVEIDDVVEVAIAEALAQDADVEVCRDTELDHFGCIGAIERF